MADLHESAGYPRRAFCACGAVALGALALASACGGGGGGEASPVPPGGGGGGGNDKLVSTSLTKAQALAQNEGTATHFGASVTCPGVQGTNQGILLVRAADGLYAMSATCLHLGGLLATGGSSLVCPCHGSVYSLEGVVTQGPAPVGARLQHFLVKEATPGGTLEVDMASPVDASQRLN